jgi:NIMA (never in mitosis gene a)-related kinase
LSRGDESNDLVVIKNIDMSSMNETEQKQARKEAKIHEVLNHPNIVKFREVYITNK